MQELIKKNKEIDSNTNCIICGSSDIMEEHCKIICKNCGFIRDCTDT